MPVLDNSLSQLGCDRVSPKKSKVPEFISIPAHIAERLWITCPSSGSALHCHHFRCVKCHQYLLGDTTAPSDMWDDDPFIATCGVTSSINGQGKGLRQRDSNGLEVRSDIKRSSRNRPGSDDNNGSTTLPVRPPRVISPFDDIHLRVAIILLLSLVLGPLLYSKMWPAAGAVFTKHVLAVPSGCPESWVRTGRCNGLSAGSIPVTSRTIDASQINITLANDYYAFDTVGLRLADLDDQLLYYWETDSASQYFGPGPIGTPCYTVLPTSVLSTTTVQCPDTRTFGSSGIGHFSTGSSYGPTWSNSTFTAGWYACSQSSSVYDDNQCTSYGHNQSAWIDGIASHDYLDGSYTPGYSLDATTNVTTRGDRPYAFPNVAHYFRQFPCDTSLAEIYDYDLGLELYCTTSGYYGLGFHSTDISRAWWTTQANGGAQTYGASFVKLNYEQFSADFILHNEAGFLSFEPRFTYVNETTFYESAFTLNYDNHIGFESTGYSPFICTGVVGYTTASGGQVPGDIVASYLSIVYANSFPVFKPHWFLWKARFPAETYVTDTYSGYEYENPIYPTSPWGLIWGATVHNSWPIADARWSTMEQLMVFAFTIARADMSLTMTPCAELMYIVINPFEDDWPELQRMRIFDTTQKALVSDKAFTASGTHPYNIPYVTWRDNFTFYVRDNEVSNADATVDDFRSFDCYLGSTQDFICDTAITKSDCATVSEVQFPICGERASTPGIHKFPQMSFSSVITTPFAVFNSDSVSYVYDYSNRYMRKYSDAFELCLTVSASSSVHSCMNFSSPNPNDEDMSELLWPTTQRVSGPVAFSGHSGTTILLADPQYAPIDVQLTASTGYWGADCFSALGNFGFLVSGSDVCMYMDFPTELTRVFNSRGAGQTSYKMLLTKVHAADATDASTLSINGPFTPFFTINTVSVANNEGDAYLNGYEPRDLIGDWARIKITNNWVRNIVDVVPVSTSDTTLTEMPCTADDRTGFEPWFYQKYQQYDGQACYYVKPESAITPFDGKYVKVTTLTVDYVNPVYFWPTILNLDLCTWVTGSGFLNSDGFVVVGDTIHFPQLPTNCPYVSSYSYEPEFFRVLTSPFNSDATPMWSTISTHPMYSWDTFYTLPFSQAASQGVFLRELGVSLSDSFFTPIARVQLGVYQRLSEVVLQSVNLTKDGYKPIVSYGSPRLTFTSDLGSKNPYYTHGSWSSIASIFSGMQLQTGSSYAIVRSYNRMVSRLQTYLTSSSSDIETAILNLNPFDRSRSKFLSDVELKKQPDRCYWAYQDWGGPYTPWGSFAHEYCRSDQAKTVTWWTLAIILILLLAWPLFIWLLQFIVVLWNICNWIIRRKRLVLSELDVVSRDHYKMWTEPVVDINELTHEQMMGLPNRIDSLCQLFDYAGMRYSITNNVALHPSVKRASLVWFVWKVRMYTWRHFYPVYLVLKILLFWWATKNWQIFALNTGFILRFIQRQQAAGHLSAVQAEYFTAHVSYWHNMRVHRRPHLRWGYWSGLTGYVAFIMQKPAFVNDYTLQSMLIVRRSNHQYMKDQSFKRDRTNELERDMHDEAFAPANQGGVRRRFNALSPMLTIIFIFMVSSTQAITYNEANYRSAGVRTSPGPAASGGVYEYVPVLINGEWMDTIHIKAQVPLTVGNFYQYSYTIEADGYSTIEGSGTINITDVKHTIQTSYVYSAYNHMYGSKNCDYDCGSGWMLNCEDPSGYATKGYSVSDYCWYVDGSYTFYSGAGQGHSNGLGNCCTKNGTTAWQQRNCPYDAHEQWYFDLSWYGYPSEYLFVSPLGSQHCSGWDSDCGWATGFRIVLPDLDNSFAEVYRINSVSTVVTVRIVDLILGLDFETTLNDDSSTAIYGPAEVVQMSNLDVSTFDDKTGHFIVLMNNGSSGATPEDLTQAFFAYSDTVPAWGLSTDTAIFKLLTAATVTAQDRIDPDQAYFPTQRPTVTPGSCVFYDLSSQVDEPTLASLWDYAKNGLGVQDLQFQREYTSLSDTRFNPLLTAVASNVLSGSISLDVYLAYVMTAEIVDNSCDVSDFECGVVGRANSKNGVVITLSSTSASAYCVMKIDSSRSTVVPSSLVFAIDDGATTQFGYVGTSSKNYTLTDRSGNTTQCTGSVYIQDGYYDTDTGASDSAESDNNLNGSVDFWSWLTGLAVGWQIFVWICMIILGLILLTIVYKVVKLLFSFTSVIPGTSSTKKKVSAYWQSLKSMGTKANRD